MGTNYYVRSTGIKSFIKSLTGGTTTAHIGKSSAGWEFNFQGYRDISDTGESVDLIVSWSDWKKLLEKGGAIYDEYDRKISFEDFVKLVEVDKAPGVLFHSENPRPLLNHLNAHKENPRSLLEEWNDPAGYSFSIRSFS